MARISEIVVEEWLNAQGYFSIRGLKNKGSEIDLVAYRPSDGSAIHMEVQDSPKPQGFLGGQTNAAESEESITDFVSKKFHHEKVVALRQGLFADRDPSPDWKLYLAYNKLRNEDHQVQQLNSLGIKSISFEHIMEELTNKSFPFSTDSDAANLIALLYTPKV